MTSDSGTSITRFTEAIPLSLSSMAHMALPLEDGVLDGLKTILQHTLWSSLSYARAAFGQNYSPVDLCTSPLAWTPRQITSLDPDDAIPSLLKTNHGFDRSYQRTAVVYLNPAVNHGNNPSTKNNPTTDEHKDENKEEPTPFSEEDLLKDDNWTDEPGALAKITLLYASTGEMTPQELEVASYKDEEDNIAASKKRKKGKSNKKRTADEISKEKNDDDNDNDNDNDDIEFKDDLEDEDDEAPPPPKHAILYRATIEYRSLPATGNTSAKKAEELSMLSFGGSLVDDDVKYGALASLYDDNAEYILEIFGVRGKKYRLDLMDATLSDGTVPTLPSRSTAIGMVDPSSHGRRREGLPRGSGRAPIPSDPFVKTLCVTVNDHEPIGSTDAKMTGSSSSGNMSVGNPTDNDGDDPASMEEVENEEKKSISTNVSNNPSFALTKMRLSLEGDLRIAHLLDATDLPAPNYYPSQIQNAFLSLRSTKPTSPQTDVVSGMSSGHRLLLDPTEAGKIYIHGRYVTTWGKDPRIGGAMNCTALFGMDLHSVPYWHGRIVDYDKLMIAYATLWTEILTDAKLVSKNIGGRLLSRLISGKDPFLVTEDYDDEQEDEDDEDDDEEEEIRVNTDMCCLESQVMASSKCDPVGISAKALATKFQNEYGMEGYPCLAHEMDWVKDRLPGRVPVVVPQRVIDVLRRGGYFDIKRTSDDVWYSESRLAAPGSDEEDLVQRTCELLMEAKCSDVKSSSIVFGKINIEDPVQKKALVRTNRLWRQYHVNEAFLTMDLKELELGNIMVEGDNDNETKEKTDESKEKRTQALALMLGMHIAREHPDGNVLMRYMLKHIVSTKK